MSKLHASLLMMFEQSKVFFTKSIFLPTEHHCAYKLAINCTAVPDRYSIAHAHNSPERLSLKTIFSNLCLTRKYYYIPVK